MASRGLRARGRRSALNHGWFSLRTILFFPPHEAVNLTTALWFVWFWFSRKFTYLAILGLWIFSGLACLVGGPGRPNPPAIYILFWVLETIVLIPLVLLYTRYNVAVFIRMTGRATRQAASFAATELDKL